jgi:hypothetical protein
MSRRYAQRLARLERDIGLMSPAAFAKDRTAKAQRTRLRALVDMPSEHDEQVALFRWRDENLGRFPDLVMMYAVPNGGHRHPAVAVKLKAEGVTPGVLDINLDEPRGEWHGLRIELKTLTGRPSKQQREWIARLTERGYCARVCKGAEQAKELLVWYLSLPKPEPIWIEKEGA